MCLCNTSETWKDVNCSAHWEVEVGGTMMSLGVRYPDTFVDQGLTDLYNYLGNLQKKKNSFASPKIAC